MSKSKQTKDFFVSYNKADRQWAEWIAWELEAAGYGVIIQAWDFAGNFVLEMDRAHREAARTVAVLSPDYLEAMYTKPEWAARFAQGPTGRDDRLIPVRVREVELEGLLAQIVYVDLLGLSEAEASERLLQRARRERAKPARRPTFPGDRAPAGKPAFPPAVPPRPRGRPPEICTLPASTADFTGREAELAHLANILAAGGRAGISAVTGMGGIGKTALAVEAAQRAAERFPDGMLFLDLGGFGPSPLAPEAALANLIAQVEPTLKPPEGLAQLGAAYRSLLAGRRMLLLLDNARDPAQLRPLLPPEPVALLATSRVPLRLPGVQPLELDALPLAEARALLRSSLHGRPADDADLDRIAAAGARLPIALRAAGAFLAEHPGWTIPNYLAALAEKRLPHLASEDDPALDVAAVLGFSIERLAAERPALALRWRLLAVFPGDFAADAAAAVWSAEPRDAADDLARLAARSLLLHDEAAGRWRLHDLYRELAQEGAEEEAVEAARERHAEHYRGVLANVNKLYLAGGDKVLEGLALFDLERPSIEAGQSWAASRMATHAPAARLAFAYTDAGAYVLSLRLPPRQRIGWLEAAVAGCRQTGDRQGEGNALGNLGNAWDDLGESRKAIELYEQVLAMAREIGDRRGEGTALGNLGIAWAALGEPRKAIGLYEQLLAIAREIGDRRGEGNALGNLGIAWANLGETRKASGLYEQHLAIAREISDLRGENTALWNLALACEELKERERAVELAKESLTIHRAIEDPFAPEIESWLRERGHTP